MSDRGRESLRVLHVTFNMGFGGTEAVIRALVLSTPDDLVHQEVICIDGLIGEMGLQLQHKGVRVTSLKRRQGFDLRLARSLRAVIADRKIDVVHCHQYTPWVYGCLASMGTGAKVVFTEHGRFHPDRYRYKAVLINRILAAKTRKLVAISSATKEALARFEFLPRSRIDVIYNGITPLSANQTAICRIRSELGLSDQNIILGTVARLDPVKNQAMMLEAVARIARKQPQIRLLIVGDGPERENLQSYSNELGIGESVIFTGYAQNPADYLGLIDIFLLSSDSEGTSMTLLEAMSLGLPIVATEAGGTPEVVLHGSTGLVTPVGSAQKFADAIINLLSDTDYAKELGRGGKKRFAEMYSVSSMVNAYLNVYGQLSPWKVQAEYR